MTNDEMERAMDFILKSQARAETRFEQAQERQARTDEQLSQLTVRLDAFADIQTNLMQVVTQTFEEQARINASLRAADAAQARISEALFASDESLRAALAEFAARQSRTEGALSTLAVAQANSDRRLDALITIVEQGRRGDG